MEINVRIDLPVAVCRLWFSTSAGLVENVVKQEAMPTRVTRVLLEVVHR